ncbi:MAG: hypothetical protein KDA52_03645 [Planctomycetaceae bacterium]|nr:hypothetical protein [Planctomycetaceae bacterium]
MIRKNLLASPASPAAEIKGWILANLLHGASPVRHGSFSLVTSPMFGSTT